MDPILELEEMLRESACIGDEESIRQALNGGANINSQHKINGWTALHWAAKRGHVTTAALLLNLGADKRISATKGETPIQVATNPTVRKLLDGGAPELPQRVQNLPIVPNYLSNPEFPYVTPNATSKSSMASDTKSNIAHSFADDSYELVIKSRVANSSEKDFIEVDFDRLKLTFKSLLDTLCEEHNIHPSTVYKIRKLPDTILRKDKDVARLKNFAELEVCVSQAMGECPRAVTSNGTPQPRHFNNVLY